MMKPFIVIGLPRSRTAWLSRFLTYGDVICGHEELRHCRSMADAKTWFAQGFTGSAETAAAPFWRIFDKIAPGMNIVLVRRPVDKVVSSLLAIPGVAFDENKLRFEMHKLDRKLGQVALRAPNVLSVSFDALGDETVCRAIWDHCLPYEWNQAHWDFWAPINVQCDFRAMMRYVSAHSESLAKLARIAKHETLASMARAPIIDMAGMTLAVEPFNDWLRDAPKLFDDHLVVVGESPGDWQNKNIELMRKFDKIGAMQIVTARSNGRMFGYLMSLIGPSMASPALTVGSHTTFYADPSCKGLGMKMQRFAAAELARKGVDHVFMQDGIRGSGGRIYTIYRRLGAVDNGQAYRLQLSGV